MEANVRIHTQRLVIEPFRPAFLEDYYREFTAEVTQYQYPDPFSDLEAARRVLSGFLEDMDRGEMLELVILSREGEFLGSAEVFGLREEAPEIGLWLKPTVQGKGYGYEALRAVVDYLNSLKKYRYYIYEADVRNVPSLRLIEKFRHEKGEGQKVTTERGKELVLQSYRVFA